MNKIGIFGGTFNPPHFGHMILAERVVEALKLDKLIFIPTYTPPHKTKANIIEPAHRLKMLKLAIDGNKYFDISDIEIKRGGTSFTYDTLQSLKEKHKDSKLYLIIGMDNYRDFCYWKNYNLIFDLCDVVVLKRSNDEEQLQSKMEKHKPLSEKPTGFGHDCNGKKEMAGVKEKFLFLDTPLLDISSTGVRKRIKAGKQVDYYLPGKVKRYIEKNKLYLSSF